MKQNLYSSYFVVVKLIGLLVFMGYVVVGTDESILLKCIHFLMMAVYILLAVVIELPVENKIKATLLAGEGILSVWGVFLFPVTGVLFLTIWILDGISLFCKKVALYALIYGMLGFCYYYKINIIQSFCMLTVLFLFYLQEKVVVERYRNIIDENEAAEGMLKTTIEKTDERHRKDLHRSRLQYENQLLEERGRISQALHDKLGHSINGSLYKLEAAKLLIEKRPKECEDTIQDVIDNLRESMDEIRMILRRERPEKKRMALLSLQSFCEECEENYQIKTKLDLGKGSEKIPEEIWEIILDNTFEAVTNALKYAKCKNVFIDIIPMNEVVRCTIRDDGVGVSVVEDGMGISGMKKRVRSVKGFFDVETAEGMGFTINMLLPIKEIC